MTLEQRNQKIVELYKAGASLTSIRSTGAHSETIKRVLIEAGIELRPHATLGEWTEERTAELKRLWAEGKSASQIAATLGNVSRSGVIGKIRRLNVPARSMDEERNRGTGIKRIRRQLPRSRKWKTCGNRVKVDKPVITQLIDFPPIPDALMLGVMDKQPNQCSWPVGDPKEPNFGFCGHPTNGQGSYCAGHHRMAYEPPKPRRDRPYPIYARAA